VWEREQDVQEVMTLLMRYMNAIAVMLMEQPEDCEPIFLERNSEERTTPSLTNGAKATCAASRSPPINGNSTQ
jgi:hypothetical protein